jgi:hypothetical protein
MTDRRRVRARVLPTAALVALVVGGALAACADTTKTLGEECLKSEDCQSGLCQSEVCVAEPPFLTVPPANTSDSGAESAAPDSATGSDSATTDSATGDDGSDADQG